jgi:hypothetical protein
MLKIFFYAFLTLFLGCNSHYNTQLQPKVTTVVKENEAPNVIDGIAFLTFKINKDPKNIANKVTYIKTIKTKGTLKSNAIEPVNSENTLNIEIFINDKLDQTITIEHPLYKSLEYLNENKSFSRKEVVIDEAEFTVRITNKTSEKLIKISENLKSKTKKELATFKL